MSKHLLWIALPWVLTACGGSSGGSGGGGAPGSIYAASNPENCPRIEGTYEEVGPNYRPHGRGAGPRGAIATVRRDAAGFLIINVEGRNIHLHTDGQQRGGNDGTNIAGCGSDGRINGQEVGRHGQTRNYVVTPNGRGLSIQVSNSNGVTEQLEFRRP